MNLLQAVAGFCESETRSSTFNILGCLSSHCALTQCYEDTVMFPRKWRSVIIMLLIFGGFFYSLRSVTVARFGSDLHVTHSEATESFQTHNGDSNSVSATVFRSVKKQSPANPATVEHAAAVLPKKHDAVVKNIISTTINSPVKGKNPSPPHHIPVQYKKDPLGYKRYLAYLAKEEDPLPKQKRAVIIFTNHRSGSTFFGELFNQHPDAFYLFEPLFPLSNSSQCVVRRDMKKKMLKELVQCSLPDLKSAIKDIPLAEWSRRKTNMNACLSDGICFRTNTKELCEDKHCPSSKSIKSCARFSCGTLNKRLVDNECRRKSLIALKVIRMCDIRDIEEIISELPVDVKILHLLRDPRGIANSRLHVLHEFDLKGSINATCSRQKQNLLTGLVDTPAWLKGRYMVVRYEDVSLYPYDIAQSVYNFVGLNFPETMRQWITASTGIPIPSNDLITSQVDVSKSRPKRNVQQQQQPSKTLQRKKWADPYGTTRDSAKTVQKWASQLPYNTVRFVEGICSAFMDMAGYIAIGDEQSFKQNKSIKYFLNDIPLKVKLT